MSFWQIAYKLGWATEADLTRAVELGIITEEEKQQIIVGV